MVLPLVLKDLRNINLKILGNSQNYPGITDLTIKTQELLATTMAKCNQIISKMVMMMMKAGIKKSKLATPPASSQLS